MPLLSSASRLASQYGSPNTRLSATSQNKMPPSKAGKLVRPSPYLNLSRSPRKPGQEIKTKEIIHSKPPRNSSEVTKLSKSTKGATIENKWRHRLATTPPPKSSTVIATPPRPRSGSMTCSSPVIANHRVAHGSPRFISPVAPSRKQAIRQTEKQQLTVTPLPKDSRVSKAKSRLSLTPRRTEMELVKVKREVTALREENESLRKKLCDMKSAAIGSRICKSKKQRLTYENSSSIRRESTDCLVSSLRLKLRENEKNNQHKLDEQRNNLTMQLKQASELVRICLGKVKEAEEAARKVPALEMELIVLRRQLTVERPQRRYSSSLSSAASCDTGFKSGSDCDLDQSQHCKYRSELSSTSSHSDLDEAVPKEIFADSPVSTSIKAATTRLLSSDEPMGRPSYYEDPPVFPRLEKLKTESPEKQVNDETHIQQRVFENLLEEHTKALEIIGNLENKFGKQRKEMKLLKANLDTLASQQTSNTTHASSNQKIDSSVFQTLRAMQDKNVSSIDIGDIIYQALGVSNEETETTTVTDQTNFVSKTTMSLDRKTF
ncbi:uncharacterized protein LOC100184093 [Ciona intestinalis]